jgi:hypothetical protein
MTAYTWIGGTGNWDVAANWTPTGGPPTSADSATISATGAAYTVTINSADVAQSLTEDSSSATVDDTGSLTLSSAFTLSAGTFILGSGGTLSGGATQLTGGTFTCDGGTLSGVTFDGALDLSETDASVYLASGTVVNNAAGTGAGTINDTGYDSALYFDNEQTFNNATINLGTTSEAYSYLFENGLTGEGTILTLGSNVTINERGHAVIEDSGYAGDGIVNKGNITVGGGLSIVGNSFANNGAITAASSDGALQIDSTTFTNSGTLAVSNGDRVTIDSANFSNTGSIALASGSSLYLGSPHFDDTTYTLAELGTVSNSGGTVYIEGTLNNTGGTLDGSSGFGQAVLDGGTIIGGTVTPAGLAFSNSGGLSSLSDVIFDGTLDLGYETSVALADGTVVNNAAGTGAGTINDEGEDSELLFDNTQTFNNATINLGSTSGDYSYLQDYDLPDAGTVLTLGSNVTIDESGSAQIGDSGDTGDGVVNQAAITQSGTGSRLTFYGNSLTNSGTILGVSSGGALTIDDATFTNLGTLAVFNRDALTIEPATFTNLSGATLTGGAYSVGPNSVLELPDNATIVTDDANIALSGAGSVIQGDNKTTGREVSFDTTLRAVGASGQLYLLADRNLTTAAAAIADNGLIQLGGGTLTVTGIGSSLTIGVAGELTGFGVVDSTTLTDSGEIVASGGTLTVQNAIEGTGGAQIDANATLVLDASTASGAPATFEGAGATLTLESPATFAGTVGGVGLDDTFDLVGVTANGASVNGSNQLVVTDNGTTVDTLQLSGTNSGFAFLAVSVSGGTDIVSLPIPATVADCLDVPSLYDQIPGGFAISDTAANVNANLAAIDTLIGEGQVSSLTRTNVTGQAYSSYEQLYDDGVFSGTDYFFTNVTDEPYSSYEYDYSAGNALVGSKFYYTDISGQAYTGEELDYNGAGLLTRDAFTGVTGAAYSAYQYDYVGGVFAGSQFTFTTVPTGATYSSYETDYDQAGNFSGDKFFFTNIQGQSYTGEEEDFDAGGALSSVLLTGIAGQAYSSLELDYSAGTYEGYQAFYTGVTGQSYTNKEVDVSASGQLEKVVYSGMTSTPYSSVEQDYSGGALADAIYNFTNVTGASYNSYQVEENASGAALQETFDLNNGGHALSALASGQTLTSLGDDTMTGNGATTFVLNAIYGADTIANLTSSDIVSMPNSEFTSFTALSAAASFGTGAAVINGGDGDRLTLNGIATSAQLQALSADFTFHA